jgi:hypothetical protein
MKQSDNRPTLVGLNMEDPLASVRDPALAALLRDGWTISAHIPAERNGRQEWVLLMAPPRKARTQLETIDRAIILIAILAPLAHYLLTLAGTQ